jgi:hypothetical protein
MNAASCGFRSCDWRVRRRSFRRHQDQRRRGHGAEADHRDPATAEAVGQLAAVGPGDGTQQRADPGDLRRGQRRVDAPGGLEADLQHLAEGEAEPDEEPKVPM